MKPIVRTVTGFISVKDFPKLNKLLKDILEIKSKFIESGYEVQTIIITTDILEKTSLNSLRDHNLFLSEIDANEFISITHLGALFNVNLDFKMEEMIKDFFFKFKKPYLTIDAGKDMASYDLCLIGARICKAIADEDPFECKRFAVYGGVSESTPFYPASRVFDNSMNFAIGMQCSNLAVEEARLSNNDYNIYERELRARMESEFETVENLIPSELKHKFIGFDTSLAPFPSDNFFDCKRNKDNAWKTLWKQWDASNLQIIDTSYERE